MLPLTLAVVLVLGSGLAVAHDGPSAESGWGTLPADAAFVQIADGTATDATAAAALVRVTHYRWEPGSGLGGYCFDFYSGGPWILLVEEGALRVLINAPDGKSFVQPTDALPLLSRVDDGVAPPVVVVPNTTLNLGPGDLIALPNGSQCYLGSAGSALVFLRVDGFPVGAAPQTIARTGIVAEQLDLDLGVVTANETVPRTVVVGRVTLGAGRAMELGDATRPLLFAVQAGSMDLVVGTDGSVVRRAGTVGQTPSEVVSPDIPAALTTGDAAYVPPGSQGRVTNTGAGPLVLFSVAVVPATGGAGSATP